MVWLIVGSWLLIAYGLEYIWVLPGVSHLQDTLLMAFSLYCLQGCAEGGHPNPIYDREKIVWRLGFRAILSLLVTVVSLTIGFLWPNHSSQHFIQCILCVLFLLEKCILSFQGFLRGHLPFACRGLGSVYELKTRPLEARTESGQAGCEMNL